MKQQIIFIFIISLILGGCGDFLEPKSKSEFVPKDANSMNELLLGEAYPRNDVSGLNIFLYLLDDDVAPAKSFHWMADEQEYVQTCGFLTAARLLMKKGDMTERASGELLDQAFCAVHSESYHVRNAAMLVIRKYMQHNEEHAFRVCRLVDGMADSTVETEQMLYNMAR